MQTTNSWGLQDPSLTPKRPCGASSSGDSYMQGLFVGDDQTPSECLKRHLSRDLKSRVEILNTGHLGYSPEQEYYTLREYADRFRPRFVVLSLFANDFGDLFEVLEGKGDWEESQYWLGQIAQYCRTKDLICLTVPAPWVNQFEGQRRRAFYPGMVSNILESPGQTYLDPFEDFATESLRLSTQLRSRGKADHTEPALQRFPRRRPLLASGLRRLGQGRRQTARVAAGKRLDREAEIALNRSESAFSAERHSHRQIGRSAGGSDWFRFFEVGAVLKGSGGHPVLDRNILLL